MSIEAKQSVVDGEVLEYSVETDTSLEEIEKQEKNIRVNLRKGKIVVTTVEEQIKAEEEKQKEHHKYRTFDWKWFGELDDVEKGKAREVLSRNPDLKGKKLAWDGEYLLSYIDVSAGHYCYMMFCNCSDEEYEKSEKRYNQSVLAGEIIEQGGILQLLTRYAK
jgi:hypothetical protein